MRLVWPVVALHFGVISIAWGGAQRPRGDDIAQRSRLINYPGLLICWYRHYFPSRSCYFYGGLNLNLELINIKESTTSLGQIYYCVSDPKNEAIMALDLRFPSSKVVLYILAPRIHS